MKRLGRTVLRELARLDMKRLMGDQDHLRENLTTYIKAFTAEVRHIFERFDFYTTVESLHKNKLLCQITQMSVRCALTEKQGRTDLHSSTSLNHYDHVQMILAFSDEPQ